MIDYSELTPLAGLLLIALIGQVISLWMGYKFGRIYERNNPSPPKPKSKPKNNELDYAELTKQLRSGINEMQSRNNNHTCYCSLCHL